MEVKEEQMLDKKEIINAAGIDKNADNHMFNSYEHQFKNQKKKIKEIRKKNSLAKKTWWLYWKSKI